MDIVSITETGLTESCSTSFVGLPGFVLLRGDVVGGTKKHGAGLYVSDGIKCVQEIVNIPNVVVAHLVDFNVFAASIYRPPSYTAQENELLVGLMKDLVVGREVIFMGDFKLPSLAWPLENVYSSYISLVDRGFLDCFLDCGLTQWVDFSTYFPAGRILDTVFSTDHDRIFDALSEPRISGLPSCASIV